MTYEEAILYYEQLSAGGIELGLTAIRRLMALLGNPQDRMKIVHIAGTNGKGSVLSYLSWIFRAAGYRVGTYSSPAVFHFREQFLVDGQAIDEEMAASLTERIRREAERLEKEGMTVTAFEAQTALAFLCFEQMGCDVIILETGLGGRLDATNIAEHVCLSVITAISMDHMQFLGDTLEQIAREKAGIIKPGCPAVGIRQEPEAERVIEETARQRRSPYVTADLNRAWDICYGLDEQRFSYRTSSGREYRNLKLRQPGIYQVENAALAAEAADILREHGWKIEEKHIRQGLWDSFWPGRFFVIRKVPTVILDGAHNAAGARSLRDSLTEYFPGEKIIFLMGIFRDKEYEKIVEILAPLASDIYTVQLPGSRRMLEAEKLKETVFGCLGEAQSHVHVEAAALADAVKGSLLRAGKEGVIVACGSLSHLSELYRLFLEEEGKAWTERIWMEKRWIEQK